MISVDEVKENLAAQAEEVSQAEREELEAAGFGAERTQLPPPQLLLVPDRRHDSGHHDFQPGSRGAGPVS